MMGQKTFMYKIDGFKDALSFTIPRQSFSNINFVKMVFEEGWENKHAISIAIDNFDNILAATYHHPSLPPNTRILNIDKTVPLISR
jgi:hypothetical protein